MARGMVSEILAEFSTPGIVARRIKYHYEPLATASACPSEHMLHGRVIRRKTGVRTSYRKSAALSLGYANLVPAQVDTEAFASEVAEDVDSLSLEIKRDWLNGTVEAAEGWLGGEPDLWANLGNPDIEAALHKIAVEITRPGPCSRLLIESCSLSIAVELYRTLSVRPKELGFDCMDLEERRVRYIKDFVLSHPRCAPDLSEIAESLAITPAHLRSLFKSRTGKTLFTYVQEIRIERAKCLLEDLKRPLKQIAYELGYYSPSAFSSAFRLATGVTPREYRFMRFS